MVPILARWSHRAAAGEAALVLPDGCRDILLLEAPGKLAGLISTELDGGARSIWLSADLRVTGLRLRPGVRISESNDSRCEAPFCKSCGASDLSNCLKTLEA